MNFRPLFLFYMISLIISTSTNAQDTDKPLEASRASPAAENTPIQGANASPSQSADAGISIELEKLLVKPRFLGEFISFYASRGFAPIWVQDGAWSRKAHEALAFIAHVGTDGLNPEDYEVPDITQIQSNHEAAKADLQLTRAVLALVKHASVGRLPLPRTDYAMAYNLSPPAVSETLQAMVQTGDISDLLNSFFPQQLGYRALKAKLVEEQGRLPAQRKIELIDTIVANLERWRWMPRDLGKNYVMVNIPDYTLKVVSNERTVWTTRVVVGKPGQMATPLLSEVMTSITVNPTWNVPQSIIQKEYLPALQRDPAALTRIGLKMEYQRDGSVRVFQLPGEKNALGRLRFNFPNKFLVYHHDTPNKNLFSQTNRALSHGCMRVQNPDKYAEVLLSLQDSQKAYTAQEVRSLYGHDEKNIQLKTPFTVHLTYQTAFVDETGRLETRSDIYGRDRDVLRALRGEKVLAHAYESTPTKRYLRKQVFSSHDRTRGSRQVSATAPAPNYDFDRHATQ